MNRRLYWLLIKVLIKRKVKALLFLFNHYLKIVYYYSWIYKYNNIYLFLCICWILNTICIISGIYIFEYKMPFPVNLFHTWGLIVIIIFQINKLWIHLSKDNNKKKIVDRRR